MFQVRSHYVLDIIPYKKKDNYTYTYFTATEASLKV